MSKTVPTLLIVGADGQVGWQLRRALAPLGKVVALDRRTGTLPDLADAAALRAALAANPADVIVNASAYTAVDKAETEEATAQAVNADAVRVMAEAAKANGGLLVHYSTDYVFDGKKDAPYVETDLTAPQGAYGRSKLAGEQAITEVAAAAGRALIFRTSWVFAARGANFVKTILRLAGERDALRVVADQIGCPTPAEMIADVTAQIVGQVLRGQVKVEGAEVYHLAAANPVSWHAFAQVIVTEALAAGFPLKLDAAAIAPIATHEYPLPAARPANSRLSTAKLEAAFGLHLPDWQPYLQRLLDQLRREQVAS